MHFLTPSAIYIDKEVCEDIADSVHHEYVALVTREQAMRRGVPLQRVVHQFRTPLSELTVEQRRAKVALAKKNSTCRRCSQSGHWAGDPECPLRQISSPYQAHQHRAPDQPKILNSKRKFRSHMTLLDTDPSSDEDEINTAYTTGGNCGGTAPVPATRDAVPISRDAVPVSRDVVPASKDPVSEPNHNPVATPASERMQKNKIVYPRCCSEVDSGRYSKRESEQVPDELLTPEAFHQCPNQ